MVAVKAAQVGRFVDSMPADIDAVLIYGPDEGLVAERARAACARFERSSDPPGEVIRIEDADLEAEPDRIAVELTTIAMFGGRKVIRTSASRRVTAEALAALLGGPRLEGRLVVEAGNLRPDDRLRLLFEKVATAAALPCYADEGQDLERLVTDVLAEAGLGIEQDARELLLARLGADRGLSRAELDKLVLFVGARRRVDSDDVEAVVGDASALTMDRLLHAMATGRGADAVREVDRTLASGESAQMLIASVQRHLHRLHRVLVLVQAGRPVADVIRGHRPPLHFKARDALLAEIGLWTADRAGDALERAAAALLAARSKPALEAVLAERLVLEVATLARRDSRQAAPVRPSH